MYKKRSDDGEGHGTLTRGGNEKKTRKTKQGEEMRRR